MRERTEVASSSGDEREQLVQRLRGRTMGNGRANSKGQSGREEAGFEN